MRSSMLGAITKFFATTLDSVQIWATPPFITFGSTAYGVKGSEARAILNQVLPGDLIFRRYSHYVTSLAIPGFFSHIGVATDTSRVVHAVHRGVVDEDILTYLRTDYILILRPNSDAHVPMAIERAKSMLGRPYDFNFNTQDKNALYCTELAMHCYSAIVPDRKEMKPRVEPDELLELDTFTTIFDSREWRT
jgi:uncharacterized protein YycO